MWIGMAIKVTGRGQPWRMALFTSPNMWEDFTSVPMVWYPRPHTDPQRVSLAGRSGACLVRLEVAEWRRWTLRCVAAEWRRDTRGSRRTRHEAVARRLWSGRHTRTGLRAAATVRLCLSRSFALSTRVEITARKPSGWAPGRKGISGSARSPLSQYCYGNILIPNATR